MKACCPSNVNKLKHRAALQSVARYPDGQGGYAESWSDEADLWMGIDPLKAWERMEAMKLQAPVTHKVLMRYRAGVTQAKRIRWGDRILAIKEVINLEEANCWLQLRCVETEGIEAEVEFLLMDGSGFLFQDGSQMIYQ